MTLIGPIEINDKGYLSNQLFKYKQALKPNIPIYLMMIHDVGWRINYQKILFKKMKSFYKNIEYRQMFKEKSIVISIQLI